MGRASFLGHPSDRREVGPGKIGVKASRRESDAAVAAGCHRVGVSADGSECKLISGIAGHSRFCVIATVVRRATARAVCRAFLAVMAVYGIPDEVLADNGKVLAARQPDSAAGRFPGQ
jgi:hypothetical protein